MDDRRFQQWTEMLPKLRASRQEAVQEKSRKKGQGLTPEEVYDTMAEHLEALLQEWWGLEKESWEANKPSDLRLGIENLKNELDSVSDFENDAIDEEIEGLAEEITWREPELEAGKRNFERIARDLHSNVSVKIDTLLAESKKSKEASHPTKRVIRRVGSGGGGGTSGLAIILMFLFGLTLGSAAAIYYWDKSVKIERDYSEKIAAEIEDKRDILGQLTVLQETYYNLAYGKLLNIPDLKNRINPIRAKYAKRRQTIKDSFMKKRVNLRKRIPAGDRLDRSLGKLDQAEEKELTKNNTLKKIKLEPYLKQFKIHQELLGKNE